jgi:hypothetical protein
VTEHDETQDALRRALHDAADQLDVTPMATLEVERARRPPTRARAVAVVASVAAVVIVAGGIVAFTSSGGTSRVSAGSDATSTSVVSTTLPLPNADVEVWMKVDATPAQIDAVSAFLSGSADVSTFAFVDQDLAYAVFSSDFACEPALVSSMKPQDFAPSFRVVSESAASPSNLQAALSGLAGVAEVRYVLEGQAIPVPDSLPPGAQLRSCGSAGSDTPATPPSSTSGSGTVPPTTLPAATTLPSAGATSGNQPADTDAAEAAVVAAYKQWLNGTNPESVRREAIDDVEDLAPYLDRAGVGNEQLTATVSVQVNSVTFTDPTHATVVYTEYLGSSPYRANVAGAAIFDGGQWKVARQTVCEVISYAGVQCPPELLTPR